MRIQRCAVGPGFNEGEMPRVLLVHKQLVRQAQRLLAGFFHQLAVQRQHGGNVFRADEVVGNHFEHGGSGQGRGCEVAAAQSSLPWTAEPSTFEMAVF